MGKSQPKSTSRRRLVRATVAVAASLLAVGIGEIVVRGLGRVPAVKAIVVHDGNTVYRRSANPILGFELKVGYRDENALPEPKLPQHECPRPAPYFGPLDISAYRLPLPTAQ